MSVRHWFRSNHPTLTAIPRRTLQLWNLEERATPALAPINVALVSNAVEQAQMLTWAAQPNVVVHTYDAATRETGLSQLP